MALRIDLHPNTYKDSVSLMRIAADMEAVDGVRHATANMATPGNLALIAAAGFTLGGDAGPNDLVIAVEADDEAALDAAFALADKALAAAGGDGGPRGAAVEQLPKSQETALSRHPEANLTLISCPGDYAAAEGMKALRLGLNVMMFSDNVAIEDEIALKTYAQAHDLLMMGPDCGTAIIQGVPLGFANKVEAGPVGIVAASGTGLQQVACLLDAAGVGISQAIGTGGRDLHAAVGGITMSDGLRLLSDDDATGVVVLISKPPGREIAERILDAARQAPKPVVVTFLGGDGLPADPAQGLFVARTLAGAAAMAADLAAGRTPAPETPANPPVPAVLREGIERLAPGQRYLRALYSGGTFCHEAQLLLGEALGAVHSTTATERRRRLDDPMRSIGHSVIDLGDDVYTRGRPHPMIDQRTRRERILQEARDPECAVLLIDVVLGYGAHPNPAAELAETLAEAQRIAADAGRHLVCIGFVCGTVGDPQGLAAQEKLLSDAGVVLAPSNAEAVALVRQAIQTIGETV